MLRPNYKKMIVKRRIPTDAETLAKLSELLSILPMTKDQLINRAIEAYHKRFFYYQSRVEIKDTLLICQEHRCHYCKRLLTSKEGTIDHKLPQARGGSDDMDNLALACSECNHEKETMTDEEYIEYRKLRDESQK